MKKRPAIHDPSASASTAQNLKNLLSGWELLTAEAKSSSRTSYRTLLSPTGRIAGIVGDRLVELADKAWRVAGEVERTRGEVPQELAKALVELLPSMESLQAVLDEMQRHLREQAGDERPPQ